MATYHCPNLTIIEEGEFNMNQDSIVGLAVVIRPPKIISGDINPETIQQAVQQQSHILIPEDKITGFERDFISTLDHPFRVLSDLPLERRASTLQDVNIEEKVDVIISEWMVYMLLYESMRGSIIFARDKWLKPGGLIPPSHALLHMAPVTNSQRYHDSIYFWRDVYGIKMSSMMPLAKQCAFMEPSVETIIGENISTWPPVVAQVGCYTIQAHELETITAAFKFSPFTKSADTRGF